MEQVKSKSKWKTWHKVVLGSCVLVLLLVGKITSSTSKVAAETPSNQSQAQVDSINRKELIEKSFSSWDGSQKKLVEYVKSTMNDPKSFEHVKTNYWDNGSDTLVLKMTYRGKNAFGGVVTEMVRAESDLKGNVFNVTAQ